MKQIKLSKDALERISRLRDGSEEYGMIVGNIALSQGRLAQLVELGRDDDSIEPWTDDLLQVMHTLSEYTDLVLALYDTSDKDSDELESRFSGNSIETNIKKGDSHE